MLRHEAPLSEHARSEQGIHYCRPQNARCIGLLALAMPLCTREHAGTAQQNRYKVQKTTTSALAHSLDHGTNNDRPTCYSEAIVWSTKRKSKNRWPHRESNADLSLHTNT
ncbi:unnamed protein product [Cercospora beticola]|nr:unnamed protein product [Cercospora beticola]